MVEEEENGEETWGVWDRMVEEEGKGEEMWGVWGGMGKRDFVNKNMENIENREHMLFAVTMNNITA